MGWWLLRGAGEVIGTVTREVVGATQEVRSDSANEAVVVTDERSSNQEQVAQCILVQDWEQTSGRVASKRETQRAGGQGRRAISDVGPGRLDVEGGVGARVALTGADREGRYGWLMKIPTLITTAGAGLALVLFSACSISDRTSTNDEGGPAVSSASTPAEAVAVSLQRSIETKTAQMDLTAAFDGSSFIGAQTVTGNGSVDFEAQRAQAHLDLLGVGIDGIVDGATIYAKSTILGSDSWYRASAPTDSARGADGLTTIWAKVFDPTQMFETIKDASSSMTEAGHEQVRGVDTIHYTGSIDLPQGVAAGGKSTSVPVEVWVDGQGIDCAHPDGAFGTGK